MLISNSVSQRIQNLHKIAVYNFFYLHLNLQSKFQTETRLKSLSARIVEKIFQKASHRIYTKAAYDKKAGAKIYI